MSKPPLLPTDYYLMGVLAEAGVEITEDDWREFKAEVKRRAAEGPQPAAVAGVETLAIISLVLTVISIGLTIVASFFKPKPGQPAQLVANQASPETVSNIRRYAPRYGFDAVQEPATIGTTIPLVYALREDFNGQTVGGIRINMPLLWSQVRSLGGSQLLRAIFLLSEGPIGRVDPRNFAIGNNSISSYDLQSAAANSLGSRLTVYFRGAGGRIRSADRLTGRSAANDNGNSENEGGPDVFSIRHSGRWTTDFCSSSKPSTQTSFGIIALLGNNLGFRVNPTIRPTVNPQLIPAGDEGDARMQCNIDNLATAARQKYSVTFSSRSGLIGGDVSNVGSQVVYLLDSSSDIDTEFAYPPSSDALNWAAEVRVRRNPFPAGTGVSNTVLLSLTTISPLTKNTESNTLSFTATFNEVAAINQFTNVAENTYIIEYEIVLRGSDSEGVKETITRNWRVNVYKNVQVVYNFTPGGTYVAPNLINNGGGSYTLLPGSFTPGGGLTTTTITSYTFSGSTSDSVSAFALISSGVSSPSTTYQGGTASFTVTYADKEQGIEKSGDVASAVASRQKAWDDAIVVGDLYKVGSALAVCTSRNPADSLFESDADFLPEATGGGQSIQATFTTVRPGSVTLTTQAILQTPGNAPDQPRRATATSDPHLYRIALANITTTRPCRVIDIGIRSVMGIRIGGLCNFKDALPYDEVNNKACFNFTGRIIPKGQTVNPDVFQSGSISTSEERYSFFRVSYREAGTNASFTQLSSCFGIRCITQQSAFNSIRFRMPATKRWEFRFEPLSGWEIRSGSASGNLELIDNKLVTDRFVFDGGINVAYKGITLERSKETFTLNSVRRPSDSELGINFTDEDSYLDAWGKLAEEFVYEEAQSSANGNPEHEVVYVNEIVENETTPLYDNLALVGLNIRSSVEFQQFSQFSAYVTQGLVCKRLLGGTGPTHLFPDILLDLLTNPRYGRGDLIPEELIDMDSFRDAAQWCQERGYFFDGALTSRQNLRQWAADTAATHLLMFGEANGRFFLRRAVRDLSPKTLFTAGNIKEGSFKFQYLDAEEREPIQVSVRWREERPDSDPTNPGLFPVEREILVRRSTDPDTVPIESIDMSDFCTNKQHAIDAAKFVIAVRTGVRYAVRFETTYEGILTGLAPSDYIRVAMDNTVYNEFRNGVITPEGVLTAVTPINDGTYQAVIWNGDNNTEPYTGTVTVTGGGTKASPAGAVFTLQTTTTNVGTFQVESIEAVDEGYLAIEAVQAIDLGPLINTTGNWIIQE